MDRDELLQAIVKGAEYIEKHKENRKIHEVAMKKYDRYCEMLREIDGR